MKKILFALVAVFMAANLANAQDLIKYNYKKNNLIYTGTERIRVTGSAAKDTPVHVKLTRVLFTDGQPVFQLRMEFEESSAWKMPKNAPITFVTTDGRSVVLKNNSDAPNLVAPKGVKNQSGNNVFLNYGEYYLEEADLKKLAVGITSIDATKRWSADGYIKVTYKNNELGSAIAKQYDAIKRAPKPFEELGSNLKSLQDQAGSRLSETNTIKVSDKLSVALVYLYYASSNSESIDLNLYLSGTTVPYLTGVKIYTRAGEVIDLKQEKDLPAGRVICYPTLQQLKSMAKGVVKVTIQTIPGEVNVNFTDDSFGKAIGKLYNSLQTVAIL